VIDNDSLLSNPHIYTPIAIFLIFHPIRTYTSVGKVTFNHSVRGSDHHEAYNAFTSVPKAPYKPVIIVLNGLTRLHDLFSSTLPSLPLQLMEITNLKNFWTKSKSWVEHRVKWVVQTLLTVFQCHFALANGLQTVTIITILLSAWNTEYQSRKNQKTQSTSLYYKCCSRVQYECLTHVCIADSNPRRTKHARLLVSRCAASERFGQVD
jgi:hypothetical protein